MSLNRWVGGALVAAAFAIAVFVAFLVRESRRLTPFEGPIVARQPLSAFLGELEQCRVSKGRLRVAGWIARRGQVRGRQATRVLLRDPRDGALYAMPTALPPRMELNTKLQGQVRDRFEYRIDYTMSGYAAGVDLRHAQPRLPNGEVWIAYDEGGAQAGRRYTLVPTPCRFAL